MHHVCRLYRNHTTRQQKGRQMGIESRDWFLPGNAFVTQGRGSYILDHFMMRQEAITNLLSQVEHRQGVSNLF